MSALSLMKPAGQLYVEYWFWYLFNDWNNTHETDWEMVYVAFNTTSVEEALTMEPERVGYAQHGGGEYANWGDDKIELDGTRLLVYPAAGSHATYFDENTWIGWGENGTGFGCDNTNAPTVEHSIERGGHPRCDRPGRRLRLGALRRATGGSASRPSSTARPAPTWARSGTIPLPHSPTGAPPP